MPSILDMVNAIERAKKNQEFSDNEVAAMIKSHCVSLVGPKGCLPFSVAMSIVDWLRPEREELADKLLIEAEKVIPIMQKALDTMPATPEEPLEESKN